VDVAFAELAPVFELDAELEGAADLRKHLALVDPERPKDSRFLFTTTEATSVSGFRKAKDRLDPYIHEAREKAALQAGQTPVEMPHWRIHDLRTSFAT